MAKDSVSRISLLLAANILIPLACLIFASGFFPYKPLLPGLNTFKDQETGEELSLLAQKRDGFLGHTQRPERLFNKVIFMVVDALRSDFVYSSNSGFQFTQSLIRDGAALPFTAHAAPPTVTMPRVKALTTGSVPSFVDLILNFAESDTSSSLAQQDTWLAQIKAHINGDTGAPGRLVFYGDDTWLKLFPDFFARSDGTSSFFVSDFTEVDNNVTRHVPETLQSNDWDAMIMHYLGLDHIGHKTGPEGPNMLPKQREMDGIVATIFQALESEQHLEDTLLVLAGDHGMNSAGNHGGSAAGETSTALLFASPKFKTLRRTEAAIEAPALPADGSEFDFYTKVQQSDLVPSLCALLGLPIPKNNLGVIMPEVLGLWTTTQLQLAYRNALQVLEIVKGQYGPAGFVDAAYTEGACEAVSGKTKLQCLWAEAQSLLTAGDSESDAIRVLNEFLLEAQDQLSSTASSYNVTRLVLGIIVAAMAAILAMWSASPAFILSTSTVVFAALTILYSIMMFATSYVEEEQHIWYWMTGGWLAVLAIGRVMDTTVPRIIAACGLGLVLTHRIAVRWNQTGQKHAGEPDITSLFYNDPYHIMWVLVGLAYFQVATNMSSRTLKGVFPDALALPFSFVLVFTAWMFKLNFTQADAPELVGGLFKTARLMSGTYSLVSQARAVFAAMGMISIAAILSHPANRQPSTTAPDEPDTRRLTLAGRLHAPLQLLLLTQSRVTNAPLFLLYSVQLAILPVLLKPSTIAPEGEARQRQKTATVAKISLTVLLLAYASYFQTGGSNAISSIDLSNAYNGVASYNILAVGVLLFLGNWAGPVYWTTAGIVLLQMYQEPTPVAAPIALPTLPVKGRRKLELKVPEPIAKKETGPSPLATHYALMTVFTAASLTATMLACTVLRTHLFIWTVFSPKYLYTVAWAIGWHGLVGGALGAVLWWAE